MPNFFIKKADRSIKKTEHYLSFLDDGLYVIEKDKYRLLSQNEVNHVLNFCLQSISPNKFIVEGMEDIPAIPIYIGTEKLNKLIWRMIKKNIYKEQKIYKLKIRNNYYEGEKKDFLNKKEIIKEFKHRYFLGLKNRIEKNEENNDFEDIKKEYLKEFKDFKGIRKIDSLIEKELKGAINWYGYVQLGENIKLKRKNGEFLIKINKKSHIEREEETKKFFKKIKEL